MTRGFVLLEVLIAFAIGALALAALYRGTAEGLTGAAAAAAQLESLRSAEAILAGLGVTEALTIGERSGLDAAGRSWRIVVLPPRAHPAPEEAGEGGPAASRIPALLLFPVEVTVSQRVGAAWRSVTLRSARVGKAPKLG